MSLSAIRPALTPTAAEAALIAAGRALAPSVARARAIAELERRGLPTRRVEAWHYTDLRSRLKSVPPLAEPTSAPEARAWLDTCPTIAPAVRLPVLNGVFLAADADPLPAGVIVSRFEGRGDFRDASDAVGLLNAVHQAGGIDIRIAKGARIDTPLGLPHGVTGSVSVATRHHVGVGEGAFVTLLEHHLSGAGLTPNVNTVTDLTVGDGAHVVWTIVQEESDTAVHLAQLNVTLGADATLEINVLNTGGALVRREINVIAAGENSQLAMRGVNLIGGERHVDVTTTLEHIAPHVTATELFRNVVTGYGSGVFQGQIKVAAQAQKTDARMACNTLLLSDTADFSAKPELEIFADDVQCAHGATVADLLPEYVFYLRSRGIDERTARAMLVKGFAEEAFAGIEDEVLREALNAKIEDWLDRDG